MNKTLIFDIETDGLLLDVTCMWVGVTYCIETKKEEIFYDAQELVIHLNEADTIVGHNIIGYDIPVLNKLSSTYIREDIELVDTYLLAKLAYYDKDKSWSHSLDAYGERLGEKKGSYNDWSKYTKEMEAYCKQDVQVTKKLYSHLKRKTTWLPKEALGLEQDVQKIVTQQYITGWEFDEKNGRALHVELVQEKEKAEETLWNTFKDTYMPDGKVKVPKRAFRRNGISTVGPHQPIKFTRFNPGSSRHIVWWVHKLYGKQEWILTEKGNPKTDGDTLQEQFGDKSWAKPLLHYLEVNKLLGQLATGDKAWLKHTRNGRIHGSMDILGTNSGRASHSNPNLGQVPSIRGYKGVEVRKLFTVPKGKALVAADLSGVELRCLAHYMALHDGGDYAEIILTGDIHTANMEAAGLTSRDQAKTMIYGYLFGAGDAKIGQIVDGDAKAGKKIRDTFEKKLPAIGQLALGVKNASKKRYLRGISGRRLHIRSSHSALNTLLQSLGAYISKYWMVVVHEMLNEEGIKAKQLAWIHDELEFECETEDAQRVGEILEEAALIAGERINIRMPIHAEAQKGVTWDEVH